MHDLFFADLLILAAGICIGFALGVGVSKLIDDWRDTMLFIHNRKQNKPKS